MASEAGVLPEIPESRIVKKWRLQPGKMFLIDLEQGRIIDDKELKDQLTTEGLAAGSATNMTQALLEYEGLQVERTIAEKLNESANLLLDKARIAASKQHIYLAAFVPPVLPDDSFYPRRYQSLAVFFLCILAVWSSVSLVVAGINDQRL